MSHVTGDGMELEEPSKESEEIAVPPEPELPAEFERLYKGCEDNPEDFNGWVYLLQYVEQEVRGHVTNCQTLLFLSITKINNCERWSGILLSNYQSNKGLYVEMQFSF